TSQLPKNEWADGAANALNPGGGQKFRWQRKFCRRESGRGAKSIWRGGRWLVETARTAKLLVDAFCRPEVGEQPGPFGGGGEIRRLLVCCLKPDCLYAHCVGPRPMHEDRKQNLGEFVAYLRQHLNGDETG